MHHEQLSTGRRGGEESVFGGVRGSTQQRRVLDGNEIEDPVAERRLEQTRVNPFDVDARTTGSGAGSIERNLGDVQSAHLPILAGQSDCVSPFAAADVERPARRHASAAQLPHISSVMILLSDRQGRTVDRQFCARPLSLPRPTSRRRRRYGSDEDRRAGRVVGHLGWAIAG